MENPLQTCPNCGLSLASHFNYCGQCATALKRLCLRCHQQNPGHFSFCGYCAEPLTIEAQSQPAKFSHRMPQTLPLTAPRKPVELERSDPPSQQLQQLSPQLAEQSVQQEALSESATYLEKPTLAHTQAHGAVARMQERRQVVILFCDLCGFTKLSEQLDPEEVSNIIHPLFESLSGIIHSYQGSIEKFIGDAIMAIFGVPVAHEDDPERALMVALKMQKTIREYGEKIGHGISMRIGLNVGTVVSGQVLYGGEKPDYTVIGDAVNTAARVEQHTPKGSILVTAPLYELTHDRFEYREHTPIIAKGKSEPIATFELLGVHKLRQATRGSLAIPLIGRESEHQTLIQWADQLMARRPVALGISGEAGIGKSRLFYAVQQHMESQLPLRTYRAYAVSYTQHASLSLLRQILRQLLQVNENDTLEQVTLVLKGHLRLLPGFEELQQSLLLQLLYPEREDRVLSYQSADVLQKQWYQVLADFVFKMAQAQPLLLILEDLQWADQTSLDWLAYFLEQLSTLKDTQLLLGATWREGDSGLEALGWHQHLRLPPLSPEACLTLFCHHLNVPQALPAQFQTLQPLAERLVERSRGNPYYLEESLRILQVNGLLAHQNDQWHLTADLDELPLPGSLQRLILSRLDRLPESLRELLQVAAVVGQSIELRLLEGLKIWSSASLMALIQDGVERGYLAYEGTAVLTFTSALMRETVYETLLHKRRAQLHQRIGDYIEASDHWQSDTFDRLAHHFIRAKDRLKAVRYLYLAARQSDRYFAHQDAIAAYQRALKSLQKGDMGPPETLIAINPAGNEWVSLEQLQSQIRLALVDVFWLMGDYQTALEHIETALKFSQERFYQVRLYLKKGRCFEKLSRWSDALVAYGAGEALLKASYYVAEMAQLKNAQAWTYYRQGDYAQAADHCEAALDILNSVPNMQELAYAYNVKGVIAYHKSEWESAQAAYERSLVIQEKINDLWGQGNTWSNLGSVYLMTARLEDAEQAFLKSLALRESLGDLNGIATSCNNLGHIYQELKQPEQAIGFLSRSLEIYTRSGNQLGRVISQCNLGMAYYLATRLDEAEQELQRGIAGLRELGVTQVLPEALNGLAEVLLAKGSPEPVDEMLNEVESLLEQDPLQTARYYRLRGWCDVLQDRLSEAQTAWKMALSHLKSEDIPEKMRLYRLLSHWAEAVELQSSAHWQHQLQTLQPELQV